MFAQKLKKKTLEAILQYSKHFLPKCNFENLFAKHTCHNGKQSLDRISVDQNCVLSLDQNYVNHLIKFHLIESVDRNFKKPKIPLLELSINCQKRTYGFWQLIETF